MIYIFIILRDICKYNRIHNLQILHFYAGEKFSIKE